MTTTETGVAAHYTTQELLSRITRAIETQGVDPHALRPEDLKPVDEFHTGGVRATEALLAQLSIGDQTRVLDIGCGLGGTARHIAHTYGCGVVGIDLTPDFVATAQSLSKMCGLQKLTEFHVASALDLPFKDAEFDLVTMLHVGMNIEDKHVLMAEISRVLAPGGHLALFDVMAETGEPELTFPFPWAEEASCSFLAQADVYVQAARAAGLVPVAERNRRDFALQFFERAFADTARNGVSPLGIHLLMRETAAQKLHNFVAAIQTGQITPCEMVYAKETA